MAKYSYDKIERMIFEEEDFEKLKVQRNGRTLEFAYFVFEYFFTIMGIPVSKDIFLREPKNEDISTKLIFDQDEDNDLVFAPNNRIAFCFKCRRKLDDSELRLGRRIIEEYLKFSMFRFDVSNRQNTYKSLLVAQRNYELAIQMGVCDWIFGEQIDENNRVGRLISELEKWSVKTYEGRSVTFGFLVNRDLVLGDDACDYIDFIHDDYSATISDCINSIIEIDKYGRLSKYHSITENDSINEVVLNPKVPYRFAHVLSEYVTGNKVGIFLLNNGDIVLSEKGKIMFVKRNLRWLNLSYEGFEAAINTVYGDMKDELKESIYGSMLDVSFSHIGGIIAVIRDMEQVRQSEEDMLANIDDIQYLAGLPDEYKIIEEELAKNDSERDISKRVQKRRIIKNLVGTKMFEQIDRKLRAELIAMDGACIMDSDGTMRSFGAIIKNNSGSSGGGRGAAAKKLSQFGFAVKISTDGYIEMYVDGVEIYAVK